MKKNQYKYSLDKTLSVLFLITSLLLSGCTYNSGAFISGALMGIGRSQDSPSPLCPNINLPLLTPSVKRQINSKLELSYRVPSVRLLSGKEDRFSSDNSSLITTQSNDCFIPEGLDRSNFEKALGKTLVRAGFVSSHGDNPLSNYLLIISVTHQDWKTSMIGQNTFELSIDFNLLSLPLEQVVLNKTIHIEESFVDKGLPMNRFIALHTGFSKALQSIIDELDKFETSAF